MISIVIPAYQEAARLPATLAAIDAHFATASDPAFSDGGTSRGVRVFVVDDASSDSTSTVAGAARVRGESVRVLRHESNRGKGAAVRTGVLAVLSESQPSEHFVLVCDADLSTPMDALPSFLELIRRSADIVIGSRDVPGARLEPPQPLMRRLLAWSFRAVRRRLMLPTIRDTQCGFKLFRAGVAADVFSRAQIDGWLGDLEILAIANRLGYGIAEVGVAWRDSRPSRVRPLADAVGVLRDLFRIRHLVHSIRPAVRKT